VVSFSLVVRQLQCRIKDNGALRKGEPPASPAMPYLKTIACLANSRKLSGRCVAGKEISATGQLGAWIRPVSSRPKQELSLIERRYTNGTEPQLLDRIQVSLEAHVSREYQVENHLIDATVRWVKTGTLAWQDLNTSIDALNGSLWIDGQSSYNGQNDRIPHEQARQLASSLKLVEPEGLIVAVTPEGVNPKRTARAHFSLGGTNYALKLTDPVAEASYLARGEGEYPVGATRLCISIGEPFEGYCYKLVAGIITP
jgi:hypothetical protein